MGLQRAFPAVGPANVRGIEINAYAAELARVSVWIGEIQWMRRNGFNESRDPILKPLETIECRDAILTPEGGEPEWPAADVVIGNPPFLGGKLLNTHLGEDYVSRIFKVYAGRVPAEADLVCYWFVKAGEHLDALRSKRVGLVSTNSIRGGANRRALQTAIEGCPIFEAWSDEPWVIDGAAVRVSLVCFAGPEDGPAPEPRLDGEVVDAVHADLTARRGGAGVDLTGGQRLYRNMGVAFMGDTKGGPFDVPGEQAREWLREPANPNGRPNSDVLGPWMNGMDVTRRPSDKWIVDFGWDMVQEEGRSSMRRSTCSIALRVDAALRRITRMDGSLTAPDIEMRVEYKEDFRTLYSIQDTPADLHETLERVSETDSEHEQRQKRLRDAFLAFRDRLTEQECHIILDHFGLDAFRTMMELNSDLADRWYALFMRLPETQLPAAHNFVLHLAHALAGRCPARAAELFRRAGDGRPMVRVTLGYTQVPLDAMSIWGGSDRGGLDDLRFQRLDGAENDHVISQEVLAAHLNGRQDLLRHYVRERLERKEPAEVAHALMVAGFSDHDPFNDNVLDRYRGTDGFIGDAHEAARYAYDRNTWARHWFERMCHASDGLEFWRSSVLFTKIVDGRHDLWQSEYEIRSEPMRLFWPSVGNKLRNRIRKWADQRKKKLFGQEVPAEIFLRPWRSEQSRTTP